MKVGYKYASPSRCTQVDNQTTLGLSPDLSRDEKVSFCGKLKHPLLFRDAMLMLREIVVSDTRKKTKERTDYFAWLDEEIERRIKVHEQYMPNVRESLKKEMDACDVELSHKKYAINQLLNIQRNLQKQIDQYDAWKDYYKIERDFWKFIKDRDYSLWFVLDPVITVHKDQVSFEAFSLDATVFEDKGKYYYVWAEKVSVGPQISNRYIAEMESGYKLKTVQVLLTTPDYDWERIGFWVNEGPAVIKRNGKIFLTYSASDTGVNYCMGMLTADEGSDLLDPLSWKKERYPVLRTNDELEIYGPGHNSFTVDEDGNDVLVYHARKETEIKGDPLYNPNRHAMLMKIKWDADGRPVFSYDN